METTIQKWGNSLGVRLPKNVVKKQSLKVGSRVLVTEGDDGIIIHHAPETKKTLKELVGEIQSENLHSEIDWGKSKGDESW